MENKFLCLMAGYDDHTEHYLAGIQKKLYAVGLTGQHTKNIPQHITLQTYPTEQEGEVVQRLQKIAAETECFDVCFSHIGIFTGGKVLFIAPDKDTDLIALKERFGPSFDWTPHTTMLIDEPENIQKALPLVMQAFASFNGKVTSLHLYEFWPTRHILTVALHKETNGKDEGK
jgi:2'-5' RNA ligase